MIGKAVSISHKKYNVIILAGGAGARMGVASDYIPKALTKIGQMRAIDFIIERYSLVAHKYIIGAAFHSDLLMSYVSGRYASPIEYSIEKAEELRNNSYSTLYCLDHADSRVGTIITFCDLIMMDNFVIDDDSLYYVSENTVGLPGTFRHRVTFRGGRDFFIEKNSAPVARSNGLLGTFVFGKTPLLKSIMYGRYDHLTDFTDDAIPRYLQSLPMSANECVSVYEFGNESDLDKVRQLWQNG